MKVIPQHTLKFLDSWLKYSQAQVDVPGYSVAIFKDGKKIFSNAYGLANIETKEALTTHHVFRYASHSKAFTATSILQLVEKRKLRLDDYVVDYLKWLKKHKDKRWQQVTIRQLLSHGAGVIRDGLSSDYWQLIDSFPDKQKLRETVLSSPLVFDPNVKMKYSNYGSSLLGEVIEAVTGKKYHAYVTDNIIKPLRLKNTYPDLDFADTAHLSQGHSRANIDHVSIKLPHVSTHAMAAATGFCSTPEDMCTFFSALLIGSGKLLTDESKREMQKPQWVVEPENSGEGEYGLSLEILYYGDRKMRGHGGGFPGFRTKTMFDSDDGYVISVATNSDDGQPAFMARGISEIIDRLGEKEPDKKLLKYEGRFADLGAVCEIIAGSNDELIRLWPSSWNIFDDYEELKYENKSTLRIVRANSFYAPGETVEYTFSKGKIDHITQAGSTMYPSMIGEIPPQIWEKMNSRN